MVFAKLSLRLSLNNPSNIWHCSKEICHKTTERERERESERERGGERERDKKRKEKKESERVGCQMIWQLPETEHHRLNFPHRFCPFCECAWFTPSLYNELSCMVPGYRFWGGYRFTVFHAHLWQKNPAILKWSSTILTMTHVYRYPRLRTAPS